MRITVTIRDTINLTTMGYHIRIAQRKPFLALLALAAGRSDLHAAFRFPCRVMKAKFRKPHAVLPEADGHLGFLDRSSKLTRPGVTSLRVLTM